MKYTVMNTSTVEKLLDKLQPNTLTIRTIANRELNDRGQGDGYLISIKHMLSELENCKEKEIMLMCLRMIRERQ